MSNSNGEVVIKVNDDGTKIFYVDVGDMPSQAALDYIKNLKSQSSEEK
jgi:hypothetical protein